MPGLRIPPEDRYGLLKLCQLPEEAFQTLLREVERAPGSIPNIQSLSTSDAEKLIGAIKAMYRVHAHHEDVPLDEFVSDISDALHECNELSGNEQEKFRGRLTKALDIESLRVASKAIILGSEHENLYCTSRIITDARAVFGATISESPPAIVITHSLKIEYHGAAGELRDIFFGLGTKDIQELRSALDRAEEKANSLTAVFKKAKIKVVDPQQD